MKTFLYLFLGLFIVPFYGPAQGTVKFPKGHSHNDYEQKEPFYLAYRNGLESIEADVFLQNDSLYVSHELKDVRSDRTLYSLYLKPILEVIKANDGKVYKGGQLQLLVDLKTASGPTMEALVRELKPYAQWLGANGPVQVVVSGSTPSPNRFSDYPVYVSFDGRPEINYSSEQLKRLGLISQSFTKYSRWKGEGGIPAEDAAEIKKIVAQTTAQKVPLRFWATPDTPTAWKTLVGLGVDYVNTDKVAELADYLKQQRKSVFQGGIPYEPYQPTYRNNDARGKVKNIILLIGDGMGLAQIYAGATGNRGTLNLFGIKNIGFSKTNASDQYITDSAAGATAFASGKKTYNKAISVDPEGKPVPSMLGMLKKSGRKTALISTGDITDATPAVYYAQRPNRSMQDSIAVDFLKNPVDILMGSGFGHFSKTGVDQALKAKGYGVSSDSKDMASLKAPFILLSDQFGSSVSNGRGEFLISAFEKVVKELGTNKQGFFLMAEGAQIDYGGHANNISTIVAEMQDFDRVVGEAMRFADRDGETLVIVTADHETGGLSLVGGDLKTGRVEGRFSTGGHTAILVPVFAYGPCSLDFRGVYENTGIYDRIVKIISQK